MKTLVDGREVGNDSALWALECLARHILGKPLPERRAWLADFEVKHGAADAEKLRATVDALQEKARAG